MLSFGLLTLAIWILEKVNGTTAALAILCLIVLTGVITWEDIITNKGAFNVFIWFTLKLLGGN